MSRFLLSCGGTGGHLSPGIALAEGLLARGHEVTLLISRKKVDSRLIEKYPNLHFVRIPGSGLGWAPTTLARFIWSQTAGIWTCLKLVRTLKPGCVLGFGGFTSAPLAVAAKLSGVPVALHEANRVPGRAVRVLSRMAQRVYLPPGVKLPVGDESKARHVGLPVRSEIRPMDKNEARVAFGLNPERRVLVILGGSQGASALNDWVRRELDSLLEAGIQVYCVTGMGKDLAETIERRLPSGEVVKAVFAPFCDRMAQLISAADLVVSRSGAGTLAELVRCHVPAVLVPFPQAADDHQRANASYFAELGGGQVIEQSFIASLKAEVLELLSNPGQLERHRRSLQAMDEADRFDMMLADLEDLSASKGKNDKRKMEDAESVTS